MKNTYWHIQMFLPEGKDGETIDSSKMLKEEQPIIGTADWDDLQCKRFKGEEDGLTIGDIIMVRKGKQPLALCEIIGDCFHDDSLTNKYINYYWFRHIEILNWASPNEKNDLFSQGTLNKLYKSYNSRSWNYINDWYKSTLNTKKMQNLVKLLEAKNQIILQGAPGTGKTYTAKKIAEEMIFPEVSDDKTEQSKKLEKSNQFKLIQFHPSYTYEDFVRGIVVETEDGASLQYITKNKILGEFAEKALKDTENNYILIIDEINRANLPAVLGELIYALEYRGEAVESMYKLDGGDNKLILPPNLYIIGTMNTADRSVGHIDYAIRRRFAFVDVEARDLSSELGDDFKSKLFNDVKELFTKDLSSEFEAEDVQLGHSYFIQQYKKDKEGKDIKEEAIDFDLRLEYEIKPILREYVKDGILKKSAKEEIEKLSI